MHLDFKGGEIMLRLRRPNKKYSPQEVLNFVNAHETQMARDMTLKSYYEGKNEILKATKAEGKSNIKASHPFASKITNSFVGYFASKPIRMDYENKEIMSLVDDFFKYNDADKQLTRLATDACIYGEAVEMLFIDKKGNIRFAPVDTTEVIVIVGTDILEEPHHVIRHWQVENNNGYVLRYIEVYDNEQVEMFYLKVEKDDETDEEVIQVVDPIIKEHLFNDVPFVFYKFAHDGKGIFERVIPLIDCYDKAVSETLNLMADLVDAILLVAGIELTDEMKKNIKELRMLNDPDGSMPGKNVRVEYITKDATTNEEVKDRLKDDIYSLCSVVNLDDKDWGTATSGTSLRMRLASMEFLAGVTQSYFLEGIRRRLELWANIKSLTDSIETEHLVRNVNIVMQRNSVANEQEIINNAVQLSTVLSKETVLGLLIDFIPDVQTELERLAKEKEEKLNEIKDFDLDDQGHFVNSAKALEGVEDEQDEETEE